MEIDDEDESDEDNNDIVTEPSGEDESDGFVDIDDDGFNDELDDMYEDDLAEMHRAEAGEFAGVDLITPRRSFKGARNIETVKDCEYSGAA